MGPRLQRLPIGPEGRHEDRQGSELIRARHVLAGMLAVEEGRAGAWIAEILQVERKQLHQLFVEAPDAAPPLDEIRQVDGFRV